MDKLKRYRHGARNGVMTPDPEGPFVRYEDVAAALEAAREDARKWRYWANGPQGTFLTDDLELATAILAAYDKDDDWTVTDIVDPTGAAIDQARGKGGQEDSND